MASKIIKGWLKSTYRPKNSTLSVTSLLKPDYYLWLLMNTPKRERTGEELVSPKSFIGSAIHSAIEKVDEDGVVKEFSWVRKVPGMDVTIGGTADELRWRYTIKKWRIGDVKTKGEFQAGKFMGVGSKAKEETGPDREQERMQLSLYRWLFDGLFDIEDKGVIYLFVIGHKAWLKHEEVEEVWLDLYPKEKMEEYIKDKLKVAMSDKPPKVDCPNWMCDYCDLHDKCHTRGGDFDNEEGGA